MKSFADWTQELAESVGEVKHHWETEKAIEPRWQGYDSAICKCDYCGLPTDDPVTVIGGQYGSDITKLCHGCYKASIQPVSAPVQHQQVPKAPLCWSCTTRESVGRWKSATGGEYDLCSQCGTSFNFIQVSVLP